ncbi:hypothetical protein [Dyadobacter sp. CY323]|uniref:hypothetical protein n=1 Tax=Dyadobacter sp. CY323 TaxID=2907302 RepID=UPI001F3ECFEE|nr:hypothetical protein [Dyadobacter sp. CY323]MCE6992268.1 hypothetical protein [Dyadobacter sp. CY323]
MTVSTLRKISVGYLLMPNLIFAWGWFIPSISFLVIFMLLLLYIRELGKKADRDQLGFTLADLGFLVGIAAVWTFLSGNGGYSFQISDSYGHNSKFYDLAAHEWPYYFPGVNRLIRYYFGYYLVPALIFKMFGQVYPSVIFAWTFLGFLLGISWVYILLLKNKTFVVVFLLIGGIGTILFRILSKMYLFESQVNTFNINIGSIFDQSRWVPNQLIPSLIVGCIILYDTSVSKRFQESVFPITLSLTWAIFPFVSLCTIFAVNFLFNVKRSDLLTFRIIPLYILPFVCLAPTLAYFAAGEKLPVHGFVWEFAGDGPFIIRYLTGVFLDAVIVYVIYRLLADRTALLSRNLMTALFILFFCLSSFVVGKWNDWLTKMNISFLVIFLICILRLLHTRWTNKEWKPSHWGLSLTLALVLCLNFSHQFLILMQPLQSNVVVSAVTDKAFVATPYNAHGDLYKTLRKTGSLEEAQQYMAMKNSFYEQYLAKKRVTLLSIKKPEFSR